eukprot:scaffold32730_cov93-Isochrysis_galbana.AAC.3
MGAQGEPAACIISCPGSLYYDQVIRWRAAGLIQAGSAPSLASALCDRRRTPSERCCHQLSCRHEGKW